MMCLFSFSLVRERATARGQRERERGRKGGNVQEIPFIVSTFSMCVTHSSDEDAEIVVKHWCDVDMAIQRIFYLLL